MVKESINSYIKADDPSTYTEVIEAAKSEGTCVESALWLAAVICSRATRFNLHSLHEFDHFRVFLKLPMYLYFAILSFCAGNFKDLVHYLQMAHKKTHETFIEKELDLALAKVNRLPDHGDLISGPNHTQIQVRLIPL